MPRGDHRQAHNEAHQRHQHGKAPGVGHAALNFAAADGFADHDDAGVAEADIEREGQLGKRLEDGHARVIFIAHVGINAVEHEHTERPQAFVRHDGQCAGAELAELLQVEVKQLPHRADQQVFLKRREDQNQHRPQPGRNARCDGRALYAEPRQAERAEDQAIVRKGVGDGRDDRGIERHQPRARLRPSAPVLVGTRTRHLRLAPSARIKIRFRLRVRLWTPSLPVRS